MESGILAFPRKGAMGGYALDKELLSVEGSGKSLVLLEIGRKESIHLIFAFLDFGSSLVQDDVQGISPGEGRKPVIMKGIGGLIAVDRLLRIDKRIVGIRRDAKSRISLLQDFKIVFQSEGAVLFVPTEKEAKLVAAKLSLVHKGLDSKEAGNARAFVIVGTSSVHDIPGTGQGKRILGPVLFVYRNSIGVGIDIENLVSLSVGQFRDVVVAAVDSK